MEKNDFIRRKFLDKYQVAKGGFRFAMDDETDELICLWNIDNQEIADTWIEGVMEEFQLQCSKEKSGVYHLWW